MSRSGPRKARNIRYHGDEWQRVVAQARAYGIPPATFVRRVSHGAQARARRNQTQNDLILQELARGPGASTLRHKLNRQLRALRPVERRALRRSLQIPQRHKRHLLTAALMAARSFAHEQGHER